jgi:hypothetical protein
LPVSKSEGSVYDPGGGELVRSLIVSCPLNRLPIPNPIYLYFNDDSGSYIACVMGFLTDGNLLSFPKLYVVLAEEKFIVSYFFIVPPKLTLA